MKKREGIGRRKRGGDGKSGGGEHGEGERGEGEERKEKRERLV